ncbi:MAG TPA: LPP20 family lipoprotein [Bacteroidota bacterium]|nr:LPP20 family lipoprotein [Bacteroidota bacterium]
MHIRPLLVLTIVLLAAAASAMGQSYPRWFLYQGEIPGTRFGAGYVRPSMYRDSSTSYAFRSGCISYAMYKGMSISGSEAFWSTEGGNAWMGSDIQISFDTSMVEYAVSRFGVLDAYHDKVKTIVLAGDSAIELPEQMKEIVPVSSIPQPDWVESLPAQRGMAYAVGEAEEYFYETSSWELAEKNARLSLGKQNNTTVIGLSKMDETEGQDVRHDTFSTELRDVRVVARWRDMKKRIMYVLLAMPR